MEKDLTQNSFLLSKTDDLCRTCLLNSNSLVHTSSTMDLSNNKEVLIMEVLSECGIEQISEDDKFPKRMCRSCIGKLQMIYEFKQMCEDSKEKFMKINKLQNTVEFQESSKRTNFVNPLKDFHFDLEVDKDDQNEEEYCSNLAYQPAKSHELFSCPICQKEFTSKYNMHRHEKIHINAEEFTCKICSKQFSRRADVKRHMSIHNGTKPYICVVCNSSFSQSGSLSRHLKVHEEFKNLPCPKKSPQKASHLCMICGKSFKTSSSLSIHLKRHTGEKNHQCTICKLRFICSSSLRNHMRTHTKEQPFVCTLCGKRFSHSSVLNRHMGTHSKAKYFSCEFCSKGFSTKYYLGIHRRQHTGEKPYKCKECFKCFADPKNYKHHLGIHLKLKPYSCTICGRNFRRKHHLNFHMGIHNSDALDKEEFGKLLHPGEDEYMKIPGTVIPGTMEDIDNDNDGKVSSKVYISDLY